MSNMVVKKNKRRTAKKNNFSKKAAAFKAFLATSLIVTLSAIGLWRCLDGQGKETPKRSAAKKIPVESVDVGKGKTADPTLVNEKQLLESEVPKAPPEPEVAKPVEEPVEEVEEAEAPKFPHYGVAFHFHAQMRAEPVADARVAAYSRRGATFRLSERISTEGCKKGWYEVEPGGLFVCSGQGVLVGDEPVSFAPSPPAPTLDKALPYRYAYVIKDNTPEFWRAPTAEERTSVDELFAKMAAREGVADSDEKSPAAPPADTAGSKPAPSSETPDAGVGAADETPLELPPFVHLRMARGYYVSVDDEVAETDNRYLRTVRGRLIAADRLAPAKPSDFEGILLQGRNRLPRVFVAGGGVKLLRRDKGEGPLQNHDRVERLTELDYLGTMTRLNREYVQVGKDLFIPRRVAAVITHAEPPEDVGENERWIDVDLSEQTLVAYEGKRPVFATLVSTGKEGFATPKGSFRIHSKHVAITMDDPEAGEEAYSIEDVPWVQYFEESYALHGAFWHNRFGRVRSHGCVNLAPKDARRLFFWTGPHLPDGVHGASATKENPGTRVLIHE
jgi:hypothetical protein